MSFLFQGGAQSQSSGGSFANMQLMGLTRNNVNFINDGINFSQLNDNEYPPWQLENNGNQREGLFQKVKQLLQGTMEVCFIIERDTNRNVVVYALPKDENGEPRFPLQVFWLMIPSNAASTDTFTQYTKEDLTTIEKRLAYGIVNSNVSFFGDLEEVNIKALENQIINIVRPNVDGPNVQAGSAGYCYATVDINGERLILERIYICTKSSLLLGFGFKATELHVEVRELLTPLQLTSYMFKL